MKCETLLDRVEYCVFALADIPGYKRVTIASNEAELSSLRHDLLENEYDDQLLDKSSSGSLFYSLNTGGVDFMFIVNA